jgi:hypothetical protein
MLLIGHEQLAGFAAFNEYSHILFPPRVWHEIQADYSIGAAIKCHDGVFMSVL